MGLLLSIFAALAIVTLVVLGVAICVSASDHIPGVNEPRNKQG